MKIVLFVFLSIGSITAFGQTDSLENRGNALLKKAKTHQLSKEELKEVRTLATDIQNRGFVLEEAQHDYAGSLNEINRSLSIWGQIRDTFGTANLLKYKGYLLGHLGKFADAKIKIDSAIYLFKAVKYPQGVAVSELDLSRVYELESGLDSALKCAIITIPFWKTQKDTFRIITSGNQVINLCLKMKKYDRALSMQQELAPLPAKKDLYWQPGVEFYFLSIQLFKKLDQRETAHHYQLLYQDKITSLQADSISPVIRYGQYP
jgi:hypothetical protein